MTQACMLTQLLAGCNTVPSTVIRDMVPYISERPADSRSDACAWCLWTEETGTTSPTNTSWRISSSAAIVGRDSSVCMQREYGYRAQNQKKNPAQGSWGSKISPCFLKAVGQSGWVWLWRVRPLLSSYFCPQGPQANHLSVNLGVKWVNDGQLLHRAEAWGHGS